MSSRKATARQGSTTRKAAVESLYDSRYCPACGTDLRGAPIPEAHAYPGIRAHHKRVIGVYSREADRLTVGLALPGLQLRGGASMIEVKSRYDGRVLYTAKDAKDVREALQEAVLRGADLRGADLRGAYLRDANLRDADLRGADLRDADLRGADLRDADLRGADLRAADLRGAYLRGAYLRDAGGLHPAQVNDLLMLYDQPGKIRAYKLVNAEGEGIYNGGLRYEVGKALSVEDADTDPSEDCGAGINLATLPWCIREWTEGYHILVCEFTAADIAAIPTAGDGKFRVHRCKVVAEKDLAELGAGRMTPRHSTPRYTDGVPA